MDPRHVNTCERCEDAPATKCMWQNYPVRLLHICESCATKDLNLSTTAEIMNLRAVTKTLTTI